MNAIITILLWALQAVTGHLEPVSEIWQANPADSTCQLMIGKAASAVNQNVEEESRVDLHAENLRHGPEGFQSRPTFRPSLLTRSDLLSKKNLDGAQTRSATNYRIFCFAWTPRRSNDEWLMPAVRKELDMCDGHVFFTDVDAPGDDSAGDWIRVQVPRTEKDRSRPDWLDHQNMVGVAPAWTHIFQSDLASQYDWILHMELDHFVMVDRVRSTLDQYLDTLRAGKELSEMNGNLLLCLGNAFLFNSNLVRAMAASWGELGAPIQDSLQGNGCPAVSSDRAYQWGNCEQDTTYPAMAERLQSSVLLVGAYGCNQPAWTPWSKNTLPMGCWQWPILWSEERRLKAIRYIATLRSAQSMSEARELCDRGDADMAEMCETLYNAANVPLMHNFKSPELHELAQELLLH